MLSISQACALLGSNKFDESVDFYRALFSNTGHELIEDRHDYHGDEHAMLWVMRGGVPLFVISNFTANNKPAGNANGSMIYLAVSSKKDVDVWHQKALECGAQNEGDPGIRYKEYAAYFRDLDGHKFCVRTSF